MPKLGAETLCCEAQIGVCGSPDVTLAWILRRAGGFLVFVHHYFGSKDDLPLLAMRQNLRR